MERPINQITIGPRRRKDLGDIKELAASIQAVGLLHPVVIKPNGTLIAGERRLAACQHIGMTAVPVTIAEDLDDLYGVLCAERDENTCRKDFSPSEAVAMAADIEPYERMAARERQGERTDKHPENFTGSSGNAADKTAAVVGMSRPTLKKAQEVIEAANEDPDMFGDLVEEMDKTGKVSKAHGALRNRKKRAAAEAQAQAEPTKPQIAHAPWDAWLPYQSDCDLLLTDPPYSTDIPDIAAFAAAWLPSALAKIKSTGRAYVCIGAYPEEIAAYLAADRQHMMLAQILVWEYRNATVKQPKYDYIQNWQAILYFRGPDAPELDAPDSNEQFCVQAINAPDGRLGERYHAWQKPDELAERLIRHSTKVGDLVLDPFAGTGTFVLAAARLGRAGRGCDVDQDMLAIAEARGCDIE